MNPESAEALTSGLIRLRGVRVHNLQDIDLDIPHGQWLSICGLSGSGKTSLALDTLFAEGQRKYVECFSPYTRQFLDQIDKPDADRIDGIPPAIAVTASRKAGNSRSTVGSVTETIDYLRLLYANHATIRCPDCEQPVVRQSLGQILDWISTLPDDCRFQVVFPVEWQTENELAVCIARAKAEGFRRVISGDRAVPVDAWNAPQNGLNQSDQVFIVVDRLKTGALSRGRCQESLQTALSFGNGTCAIIYESVDAAREVDKRPVEIVSFSRDLKCNSCGLGFADADPGLFNYNKGAGACRQCEGFGDISFLDINRIVPDPSVSIRDGAIAPWNTPAYRHELEELLQIAEKHALPVDVPFSELGESQRELIWTGDREADFGGLNGFFEWLEKRRYKMHLRVFLSRWKSWRTCEECSGSRLNETALSWTINDLNIAQMTELPVNELIGTVREIQQTAGESSLLIRTIVDRLQYLIDVGVGYLSLSRSLRTLSGGERQRVALTRALGSSLVNLLYVLDEPSNGLHSEDVERVCQQVQRLSDRNNTVVVVDHHPRLVGQSSRVVELGPAAGMAGGHVVFDGTPESLVQQSTTSTGQFMSGERGFLFPETRRNNKRSRIRLSGAAGNNLQDLEVEFPLGLLCVVSGVSGSGKSTLVRQTLVPAMRNRLGDVQQTPLPFRTLRGGDQLDEIAFVDQEALAGNSRSNPATYIKAWDEIRKVFAETSDAKSKGLKPGAFSFNVEGGRCEACRGEGYIRIDMQFMPDVLRKCEHCHGTRFKPETARIRYRNRNIADVLNMTVHEAFTFFRGHRKIQARLKFLKEVGLEYVQLGQPASTLSSGESQRLKLAGLIGGGSRKRTLFVMDEPTAGLHMADVMRLIDCFNNLIDVGHSLIVIEHNLLLLAHADHIIDMGPGAADEGGTVVVSGTPEQIGEHPESRTGHYLKQFFKQARP